MNSDPYFLSLQGGDYHVYPDGSLLISGAHSVNYPDSGWSGLHNLIWFTNTGRLDTTRTPRKGNGVIYRILELPPGAGPGQTGKFMCTGPMTVYEGQPTSYIFRVHADGSLDTSFYSGVFWGQAACYLPLPDGRCYVGGVFRVEGIPDTLQLVRFMPDGSLDPTFNHLLDLDRGELTGFAGSVSSIRLLNDGRLLVTGGFRGVDDLPHYGMFIVDSTGQVVPQLEGQGCGIYVYQSQTSNVIYGTIAGTYLLPDNMMYIWGAYHGYDDGVDSDPLQRFVTRLYGPDFGTGVVERAAEQGALRVFPNPASSHVTVDFTRPAHLRSVELVLKDAMGRPVLRQSVTGQQGRMVLGVEGLARGLYLLEVLGDGPLGATKLVVQ